MPALAMNSFHESHVPVESGGEYIPCKQNYVQHVSPRSPLSPHTPQSDSVDIGIDGVVDTSIDKLYQNVCEMDSSDQSPSGPSLLSYGEESRIDSELYHLVGDFELLETTKDVVVENKVEGDVREYHGISGTIGSVEKWREDVDGTFIKEVKSRASAKKQLAKYSPKGEVSKEKPLGGKKNQKKLNAIVTRKKRSPASFSVKNQNGVKDSHDAVLDNPDLGPFLLKRARDMIACGENNYKALDLALRAVKSFEKCASDTPNLEHVMSLHILATIYCNLGECGRAIPVLEQSIEIPKLEFGEIHALAKFSGCMQLGDTHAMLGQIEKSIFWYTAGLEIQRQALGEAEHRIGETCRYVAEAHVQALRYDEAEKLCQMALDIHKENGPPGSAEEAADRRLMGLICDLKGDYESAIEHYVLASMAMASKSQDIDVASTDCGIGDAYLSLARYDEAIFAYQKALTVFKSAKGENHPEVASVFVHLADLYNKRGKFGEARSYSENALHIYAKPNPGIKPVEIACGLIDLSAVYQSMNEMEQALKLLKKVLRLYGNAPGQQSITAGIEAQIGVIHCMMGNYSDSYSALQTAVKIFYASGEKESALLGIILNQMGLACVQLLAIPEAAGHFEKARSILEEECGPYHPKTLGVYCNLASTYDAMGRLNDAIDILEFLLGMREEKLGTANPDVEDQKRRLAEMLKEAGRVRRRKSMALETLLDTNNGMKTQIGIETISSSLWKQI